MCCVWLALESLLGSSVSRCSVKWITHINLRKEFRDGKENYARANQKIHLAFEYAQAHLHIQIPMK